MSSDHVVFTKSKGSIVKDIMNICTFSDYNCIKENIDGIFDKEKCMRIASTKNHKFFVAHNKTEEGDFVSFGRVLDNSIFKFKIVNYSGKKEGEVPMECFSRYIFITFGIENDKLKNTMQEVLSNKIQQMDLSAIEYAVVFYKKEGKNYVLSVVRIDKKGKYTAIGPEYELELVGEITSDNNSNDAIQTKKQKNVTKTVTKDVVGRIYVEKQDLRDVKVRSNVVKK